jgi:hypothetical protein
MIKIFIATLIFQCIWAFSSSKFNMSKLILTAPDRENASISFYHFNHLSFMLSLIGETGTFVFKNERFNIIEIEKSDAFKIKADKTILQGLFQKKKLNLIKLTSFFIILNFVDEIQSLLFKQIGIHA